MECEYDYCVMYVGRLAVVQRQPLRQKCEAGSIIGHYFPPTNTGTTQLETAETRARRQQPTKYYLLVSLSLVSSCTFY